MNKHLLVASLIPSLLAPLIASAISLNELQSDPNRYDILLSMRIRLIRSTLTQIQSRLFAIIRPTTPCKLKFFLFLIRTLT